MRIQCGVASGATECRVYLRYFIEIRRRYQVVDRIIVAQHLHHVLATKMKLPQGLFDCIISILIVSLCCNYESMQYFSIVIRIWLLVNFITYINRL